MTLALAIVFVKDLPRMEAFYRSALGVAPIEETRLDTWVEFDAGLVRFGLHAIPGEVGDSIVVTSPPRPREGTPIKLVFESDDPAGEMGRLESLGAVAVERPWGGLDVVDPEGNVFGIRLREAIRQGIAVT